ncbi:helicase with zinc finger domain 2-like [Patiria miniata]|uniref:Uncharacterized protein n=1 Tax=Patiria miniata TaxID=46514 RepID=A0A913ZCQ2_PATMI|nr:helicase with zinc finger domain 2-like [Patiria miniata]XP_038048816.1 helicase with zinc finger domain 2-like [Patiria miniata]XP_038048817.1 helicase with zinc finger domain 2-like [Patiria miniata]XP_038048818.1 helicase with zinc finger domain 2-like [Patiria miniata]
MSRSREERQRDIEDGLNRLRFHPDRIPIGYEAKTTIREVQRLMKDEATDLMAEGDYQAAGSTIMDANKLKDYLLLSGYSCSTTLDKSIYIILSECTRKLGFPEAALQDSEKALLIDPNCERARMQQLLARYEIAEKEWINTNKWHFIIGFESLLSEYPERILLDPRVQEIIANVNRVLDPHKEYDHMRRRPKFGSTQNGEAAGAVAMEWLPDHVKANKKNNQKAKANTKSKKKNKTKQLVKEESSEEEEEEDDTCDEIYESDASSISPRGAQSDSPVSQGTTAAKSSSSYGLDDFGPIHLPHSNLNNGAIPKVVSSKPTKKEAAPEPPGNRISNASLPTGTPTAGIDYASLYCKICKVQSNAQKQLLQHLSGTKHIAKQAEYMKNLGGQSAGNQLGPGQSAPTQHASAQPQKFSMPTKNASYASQANPGPGPTMQQSAKPMMAASNAATVGPPPVISQESMHWLKKLLLRLACEKCYLTVAGKYGYQAHRYQPHSSHHCFGGWLVCRLGSVSTPSNEIWGKIRRRTKPDFLGPYTLCEQFNTGVPCKVGEESCWFCHSREEVMIWDADRAGHFNGKEIVTYLRYSQGIGVKQLKEEPSREQGGFQVVSHHTPNRAKGMQPRPEIGRSASKMAAIAVPNAAKAVLPEQAKKPPLIRDRKSHLELMSRVRGHFLYLCGSCFDGAPQVMALKSPTRPMCSNEDSQHPWELSKALVHVLNEGRRTRYQKVRPKPKGIPARAYLCNNLQRRFGCRFGDLCKFAHNLVEIEVWEFEVLYSLVRDTIVQLCSEAVSRPPPSPSGPAPAATAARTPAPSASQPLPTPAISQAIPKFFHDIRYVCGMCFPRNNQCVGQNPRKPAYCAGSNPHPWQHKMVVVFTASKKKYCPVKPRHPNLRREIHPKLCRHLDKCRRAECMFPHFDEEGALWKYMATYNLKTLDEVMLIVQRSSAASSNSSAASNATAASNASSSCDAATPSQVIPGHFTVQRYYCSYCDRGFAQNWQLQQHTQTIDHRAKVNSDKERQWKYRSPPWSVLNGEYRECEQHKRKACVFTNSPADKNNCTHAHSSEELEEWRERHQYRMMKMKKAKDQKLYAFMDEVLEKYNYSTNETSVIIEELPGIHIQCPQDLNKFLHTERKADTTFTFTWKFLIKSKKQQSLKRVGLLYDDHRLHFYLSSPKGEDKPQVCPGNRITEGDGETYHIDVLFHSRMLGSFNQWVLFDFGSEPVLVRKLEIHVGSEQHFETFQKIQHKKQIQTWDSSNSEIVKFLDGAPVDQEQTAFEEKLLATYKPPTSLSIDDIELGRLDRDNYKLHMHKMLHLEEREQTKRIARFSIETTLNAAASIELAGQGYLVSHDGQMYASINLKQALMDDSEASQIIMRSVKKMLLKFDKTNKVYEAAILRDQDYGSQAQDNINLKLSPACVGEQNLTDGATRTVQVQFQLNRLPFCHQHYAVEEMHNMDMVFPPPNKPQRFPFIDADHLQETNFRQERAASYICKHGGSDAMPMHGVGPVLVFGPFGTGKTYTLATAVRRAVVTRPLCRILICTRSNSAADWYITEHLHKFVEQTWSKHHIRMLRIYATYRKISSIDPIVRPYVLMDESGQILLPDANKIRQYHIVITTVATSGILGLANLQGHFTHILIDEAGQTLETEVLQPLTLATGNTCVVLAGDHIQMSPKVFSDTARAAKFNKSLLERLFLLHITNVVLTYNYRTCEQILKFIAETYYHQQFKALGNHPVHPDFYPLSFCAVKGEDQHVGMSYVNNLEVLEIVFRAEELCRKWPEKWGKFNKNSIGIISPYSMQVRQIRFEMRRRGLGDIDVETVENVQGKQFRALLISTVRTRSTLTRSRLTAASQVGSSNQQDEEFYYGFLSDHKLLNTALTRAQSLVIVAGDPITLCSEGQCATTWKAFLKDCEKNNSLQGTTMEEIRQEVEAAKHRLNPFAKSFQPSASRNQTSPPRNEPGQGKQAGNWQEAGLIKMPAGQNPWKVPPKNPSAGSNLSVPGITRQSSDEFPALRSSSISNSMPGDQDGQSDENSWSADEEDIDLEDAILQELHRQVLEDRGELEVADHDSGLDSEAAVVSGSENDIQEVAQDEFMLRAKHQQETKPFMDRDSMIASHLPVSDGSTKRNNLTDKMNASRKLRNVRMVEGRGHILLIEDKRDRSRLEGVDTFEEYDSDEDVEEDELDETVQQENLERVGQEPDRYKICSFHFDLSGHTYALPKDEDSSLKILITSKRKRGKALNLDEIIVEILEDIDELENAVGYGAQDTVEEKKTYGKVICVLKRAVNPYLKKIVCTIDRFTDNLMVPIDRKFPKIFAYSRKDEGQKPKTKSKKNQVPEVSKVSIYNICRASDQGFQFQRNVEVSRKDRPNKLFVVQYLKWHAKTPYPVGIITEELPPGDTKEDGLRILKLVHGIRERWKHSIVDEIADAFPEDWEIPKEVIKSRYDARSRVVFTIDPPESQDLDDALSIDMVEDNYFIGIHIADVSYFVKKGSALDDEAKERATSFYPSFAKPVNMLPPQLSNKLCSLLPEQDRLTISVFVTLDENGEVVGNVNIVRSVIRSRIQLSYDAAENIIKMTDETEQNSNATIQEKIMTLSKLAKERRRIRLGAGRFAFSHDAEEEEAPHPLAHSLVEEMMLLANEAVARFLMMKYPKCTPLRRQLPPGEEEVKKWFDKHGKDVPNSVDLQSRPSLQELETEEESDVHVLRETWHKLKAAVEDEEQNDLTRITDIICSDENHPQLAVALSTFFRIQERSAYISSGDHPSEVAKRHHTLGMPSYTHFTSPIRRFLDLVVHRMLIASLENIQAQNGDGSLVAPYTSAELAEICHHCTNQAINCQDFDKKTHAFQLALKLKEAPEPTLAFVVSTSDAGLGLLFPYRRFIPSRSHSIPLRLLKPIQKPVIEGDASLELVWKHRIYDISGTPSPVHVQPNSEFRLDTRKFIIQISANQWQEIITGIKTEDIYQIRTAVMVATDEQERREQDEEARRKQKRNPDVPYNLPLREVTCERSDPKKPSLFINFKRNFDLGDVVQVQLHASTQMGLLAPTVQLFGLTPKFHLCTEHRKEAITSFAEVATHRPVGMRNISSYKKVWLPIIEMLTAHNAVQSDETIIIHSVKIRWDRTFNQDTNSYDYSGFFTVREDYCDDHHIRFSHPPKINKNEKSEACDDPEAHLDYLCIRYGGLTVTSNTQLRLREMDCKPRAMRPTSNVHPGKMTFVLHAATVDVTKDKGMVVVQVTGTQFSSPFPDVLLSSDPPSCTVELVPKTQPDRRLENAVRRLDSDRVSPLIRDICLLQKPRANQDDPFSKLLPALSQRIRSFEIPNSPFAKPNASQSAALRQAVAQPFTVIQGPPGTGKTITGAHLAHFFTVMNKGLPPSGKGPPQVLYCGPSNKSVDVISTYLQKLNAKVVRVYSETIERKDYPIPGEPGSTRKTGNSRDASMDPQLKGISLHHLIRQKTNTRCQNILKWEQMFRSEGYVLKTSHVKAYKHEISKAEEEELKNYQIILCTCNAAGSKRIKEHTNIVQCIIDEAGMCNEPETLIPLVSTNPCQVVLIGDHKQLRPIIQEKTAQILGMEISLLEKYEKKAHMLTMQYRMHEAICDFPSHAFYDGKLETADIVKRRQPHQQVQDIWPGGRAYPLVFCHLYGKEETLTVKTAEGNEQSKSNPQEVKHVVRMATSLVRRYQIKPEDIVILSQYRLQCAEIEDVLKRHGVKGVSVRTVITSQGSEWDYVIMSTVRSLPRIEIEEKASVGWKQKNLGFIIDENQMNVALSRAKRGLIVIGNQYLLQTHEKWKELIDTYRQHQAVVDARSFLLSR